MGRHGCDRVRADLGEVLAGLDEQARMIDRGDLEGDAVSVAYLEGARDMLRRVLDALDSD